MSPVHEIKNTSPLTQDQVQEIERLLVAMGEFQASTIRKELEWFLSGLGLHEHYFLTTPLPVIAQHVASLKASRILHRTRGGQAVEVLLIEEQPERAMYVLLDRHAAAVDIEHRIERKYPPNTRIQSFRTLGTAETGLQEHLRLYFVSAQSYEEQECSPDETELNVIADKNFLNGAQAETLERYQRIMRESRRASGPFIEISEKPETREMRIMVAVPTSSSATFFTAISDMINFYGIHSNRKYREPFANGTTIFTVYLDRAPDDRIFQNILEDISLLYAAPKTELSQFFQTGQLSAQAATYAFAAGTFALQFLTGYSAEYQSIAEALKDRPELMGTLQALRARLVKDSYSPERIHLAITRNLELVRGIYEHFAAIHFVRKGVAPPERSVTDGLADDLRQRIRKTVVSENDRKILNCLLDFNGHVLRTNFYKDDKVSLAFRLKPEFLERADYPERPYGIYYVLSPEFRGFHVRFRDVARGGIRIVRSANAEVYRHNSETAFDENYTLALTQQRKNKDIPEGGSKGVILLAPTAQDRADVAFQKYIHGLLDLMMPNEEIRDLLGAKDLLFLGPDEGTAEMMDAAAKIARRRGYPFWRAFTTGKSLAFGGVPHDRYGMTTRGVHEFVLRSLEKLGLKEEDVTKIQTGGPDGDLGSNEILISRDRTLGVVDGSGVLYDPDGIDRVELSRLARERKMVKFFDRKRLSARGFLVLIEDMEKTLPDGTFVENGVDFRNGFHLSPYAKADLFVPCGGRPRSVSIHNWRKLLEEEGPPKFKVIVEGANLFLTQEARIELERRGVIIFKDASANKGGVTSSSLEVLSALSLSDDQYDAWMAVQEDKEPEFRRRYVEAIWKVIQDNAALEFERIWQERERTGQSRALLSDQLSTKINQVSDAIRDSDLWSDERLRRTVITLACPEVLMERVGLPQVLGRVPENYLRAMLAAYIGSRFVYRYGMSANEVDFLHFIRSLSP
jgi:glutamate dehydrogenase